MLAERNLKSAKVVGRRARTLSGCPQKRVYLVQAHTKRRQHDKALLSALLQAIVLLSQQWCDMLSVQRVLRFGLGTRHCQR